MNAMLFLFINLSSLVTQAMCGLQPYYLHFPPPYIPVSNGLESEYPQTRAVWTQWPQNIFNNSATLSRGARNFPSGPIPLVVHTWVKPDDSAGTRLQNGTLIYYIGGPWGGIRASTPSSTEVPKKSLSGDISNSLQSSTQEGGDYNSRLPERAALLERVPEQIGHGWGQFPTPNIDLTIPPSRLQEGEWGNGNPNFGWPSSAQIPDITTTATTSTTPNETPTRSQYLDKTTTTTTTRATSTTTPAPNRVSGPPPTRGESVPITENDIEDSVAANTNARFPVSESVRKFRRIVAQIRAITKKELAASTAAAAVARRESKKNS